MQKITKRWDELTDLEQQFFNAYINGIASGGNIPPLIDQLDDIAYIVLEAVSLVTLLRMDNEKKYRLDWAGNPSQEGQ